ncbi:unnamed protein product, partial [Aphanomyces euteiches]
MIADIFTKALPAVQFQRLRTKMGVKQAHHDLSGSIEKANQGYQVPTYQVSQSQVPKYQVSQYQGLKNKMDCQYQVSKNAFKE